MSDKKDAIQDSDKEDKFLEVYTELDDRLKNCHDEIKCIRHDIRKLLMIHKREVHKAQKMRKKKKPSGIAKARAVPDKLAELAYIKKGTVLSTPEYTKYLYANRINKNGLYYKKDKRVLRPDKEMLEIFGLDESVNEVTDPKDPNGLTFFTLQKYINKCFKD